MNINLFAKICYTLVYNSIIYSIDLDDLSQVCSLRDYTMNSKLSRNWLTLISPGTAHHMEARAGRTVASSPVTTDRHLHANRLEWHGARQERSLLIMRQTDTRMLQ